MRLQELKQQVYEDWERRCWYNGAIVQPELFKLEVRTFGDLRCKSTWVCALCRFHALNIWDGCMDSWTLITLHFNFHPGRWDYELRQQILDEFLTIPGALDALKVGFEQLFGSDVEFTPQEKEAGYGLLAMVGQQSGKPGGTTALPGSERS